MTYTPKTINIKGKEYVTVSERVREAHEDLKDVPFSITTDMVSNSDKMVVVKATVTIGERVFTGYSQAEWGAGMMGRVALEVAETSAIGRALGFAGYGIVEGIASADEIIKNKDNW